jgi:hypothetical protein
MRTPSQLVMLGAGGTRRIRRLGHPIATSQCGANILTLAAAPPLVVWTDCALGTDDRFLRAVRLAGNPWREERLLAQLQRLVDAGNSVLVVEHDMSLVAACDWVVDLGPGAGDEGGRLVARDPPQVAARQRGSRTAPWLAKELGVSHA